MKKKPTENYFIWDYNDECPVVEMLKHQRKNPKHALFDIYDHGGTFSFYIFAENINNAKKCARRIIDCDSDEFKINRLL